MFLTVNARLVVNAVLSLAYPQACLLCGVSVEKREFGIACEDCWNASRVFTASETICWKCGLPSAGVVSTVAPEQVRCRRCDGLSLTAARACGVYERALRESVLRLKREPYIAAYLMQLLVDCARRHPLNLCTRVIPVPLHKQRERMRGFNQAAVIGSRLATALKLPFDDVSLRRTGPSDKYRAGLDAKGRHDTVVGAFSVQHPALVSGENILLVDDVFTTGATVSSCGAALLTAGAANVFVLTIARPAY